MCAEFGMSPAQAARELDDDPEHLAIDLIEIREYMRCKAAYDKPGKDDAELDPWRDSEMLELVKRHTYERVTGRKAK